MAADELAAEMQRRATACVNAAANQSYRLDYSPESIEIVEQMIEDLFVEPGAERPDESFQATIPPIVGAYVGEVFVRALDGHWGVHPEYGEGVQLGSGTWVF